MNNIRIENWNGHQIRFVKKDDEWWAVGRDIAEALGYSHTPHMTRRLGKEEKDAVRLADTTGRFQRMTVVSEVGIYEAIFGSELEEAKEFKKWVKRIIKELRLATSLEGFQVFCMLDKEHQKEAMAKLRTGLQEPVRVDYIKANTIANKAVSSLYGYPKMLKKGDMSPDMLVQRQQILDDTVNLMTVNKSFRLALSISQVVYDKYLQ